MTASPGSGPRIRTWYGAAGSRSRSSATRNVSLTGGLPQPSVRPSENCPSTWCPSGSNRTRSRRVGQAIVPSGVSQRHDRAIEVDARRIGAEQQLASRRARTRPGRRSGPPRSASPTARWWARSCQPSPLDTCRESSQARTSPTTRTATMPTATIQRGEGRSSAAHGRMMAGHRPAPPGARYARAHDRTRDPARASTRVADVLADTLARSAARRPVRPRGRGARAPARRGLRAPADPRRRSG